MIILAYGANLPSPLGSPAQTYEALPDLLQKRGITALKVSSLYRTKPVPVSDQPDYYNAALSVQTDLSAYQLLEVLHAIESDLGRTRTIQNASRGIDLDLIAYNDEVIDNDGITIPHPRMHERAFVLQPLAQIHPDWQHPTFKKSALELLNALK